VTDSNEQPAPDHKISDGMAGAKGKPGFQKGHPRYGGRKKGQANKTTTEIRRALLAGPAQVGDAAGKGGLSGFCAEAARELALKQDRAGYLSTLQKMLPKPVVETEDGLKIDTVNVIPIPPGMFFTTFEGTELLRKLRDVPGAMESISALMEATRYLDHPPAVEAFLTDDAMLERLKAIPAWWSALRQVFIAVLPVAEKKVEERLRLHSGCCCYIARPLQRAARCAPSGRCDGRWRLEWW
jgi:hypothetical protein